MGGQKTAYQAYQTCAQLLQSRRSSLHHCGWYRRSRRGPRPLGPRQETQESWEVRTSALASAQPHRQEAQMARPGMSQAPVDGSARRSSMPEQEAGQAGRGRRRVVATAAARARGQARRRQLPGSMGQARPEPSRSRDQCGHAMAESWVPSVSLPVDEAVLVRHEPMVSWRSTRCWMRSGAENRESGSCPCSSG